MDLHICKKLPILQELQEEVSPIYVNTQVLWDSDKERKLFQEYHWLINEILLTYL